MKRPEKKDLQGVVNIFGRGSVDACIACGYNEACDAWETYHQQEIVRLDEIIHRLNRKLKY